MKQPVTFSLLKEKMLYAAGVIAGPYDYVVKLSYDTLKESIGKHMTRIRGILSTLTLMAE